MSDTPPPPPPPQQPYAAATQPPYSPGTDQQLAAFSHLGNIIGPIPALIIWLIGKDRGPKTNTEGKEALNWAITFVIIYIAAVILFNIIGGIVVAAAGYNGLFIYGVFTFLYFLIWIGNLILSIMGFVRVNGGGSYRYPFNFRFIK